MNASAATQYLATFPPILCAASHFKTWLVCTCVVNATSRKHSWKKNKKLSDKILPTDPIPKSKLSSDASFLLDFNLPWRLTIFKFSVWKHQIQLIRFQTSDGLMTTWVHLRSKHTNTVSLSSWVTWMASTCWLSARGGMKWLRISYYVCHGKKVITILNK